MADKLEERELENFAAHITQFKEKWSADLGTNDYRIFEQDLHVLVSRVHAFAQAPLLRIMADALMRQPIAPFVVEAKHG